MFDGCALVNDSASKDPAVIAALSSLQEQGWPNASGLGTHYCVDSEDTTWSFDELDPDELQEYWEEYSL